MLSLSNEMKREIIMDHYKSPSNKVNDEVNFDDSYISIRMDSDSCIDDITIFLKIEDDIVKDAKFKGVACAISTASTDILCDLCLSKNKSDALKIISSYEHMLHEESYDSDVLEELNAFSETYKQAARIKCASLGARGISKLINGEKDE